MTPIEAIEQKQQELEKMIAALKNPPCPLELGEAVPIRLTHTFWADWAKVGNWSSTWICPDNDLRVDGQYLILRMNWGDRENALRAARALLKAVGGSD